MIKKMSQSRREFLQFFGLTTLALTGLSGASLLTGCTHSNALKNTQLSKLGWTPIAPSLNDQLLLADGLNYSVLAKWQDQIGGTQNKPLQFGTHNDFTSFIPFTESDPSEGILMVNHEYLKPLFVSGFDGKNILKKTRSQVEKEIKSVGISLLHIKKVNQQWTVIKDSKHNTRFDGSTPIPIISEKPIFGSKIAYGTMAGCAGGKTPWNTFLSCEENYDMYYGEWKKVPRSDEKPNPEFIKYHDKDFGWHQYFDRPPLHYGWVVEINPITKKAKKFTALGRFCHEGATCIKAGDGRTVVYMGDDNSDECIYKFISEKPGSLETGTLYVANTQTGKWLPLTINSHPDFKKLFRNQTDLLIQTRLAAKTIGGTPQDRPEDIEINPSNGDVIVALTNNKKQNRPHGSLLKIVEKNADHLSLEFIASTWISGGEDSGLSSPDNLAFDKSGNLWVTTDRAEAEITSDYYKKFMNNGLFYIPMKGPNAGKVFQVASAPVDAEFTAPTFSPDGKTLFLCVQHPGDNSQSLTELTSNWPSGKKGDLPRSAIVTIEGPLLDLLTT